MEPLGDRGVAKLAMPIAHLHDLELNSPCPEPPCHFDFLKILDRYLLSSLTVATLMGVTLLSVVLVLGNVFKEILDLLINHDVPLSTVLAFVAFVLPFSMTFTIPWGFLTAVLLVFGRLSADSEIIAFRANGVSFPRILVPVLFLSLVLVGICLWINIDVAPRAQYAMLGSLYRIATSNPASLFQADEVVDQFPDRRIFVGGREGDMLKNLVVFELDEKGMGLASKVVFARSGTLSNDTLNSRLLLRIQDATFEQKDSRNPENVDMIRQGITMREGVFPMSLKKLLDQKSRGKPLSSHTLGELISHLADPASPRRLAYQVEISKRFSLSLAAFSFALIAVPLGITAHRKETSVGFALSLAIAFGYFFFIIIADTFRETPHAMPVLLVWLPNFLFTALGIWLFSRLARR
jgi:lipopolysaccharide export LptBFGC system permease protein LptF